MKFKTQFLTTLLAIVWVSSISAVKYSGGDISLLPTIEEAGAKYTDQNGNIISDLITYSYDQGMNAMRVRVFVNPDNYTQSDKDPYACQSLEYILSLSQRIKSAGHKLLLDFHYSDTWADPVKQWTPKEWENLNDEELYNKIYNYTKETLQTLKNNGATPDFIQTGNEISYGMLWGPYKSQTYRVTITNDDSNRTRFGNLLTKAIAACREVCPQAKIVLHNERITNLSLLTGFYNWAKSISLDYDIIGLSYYPYFHGNMSAIDNALSNLDRNNYGKEIWIV